MPYKIQVTFPAGVTQDDLARFAQGMVLNENVSPPGSISHTEYVENGRVVFVDEWESKATLDAFLDQAIPAMVQAGIPEPEVEEL